MTKIAFIAFGTFLLGFTAAQFVPFQQASSPPPNDLNVRLNKSPEQTSKVHTPTNVATPRTETVCTTAPQNQTNKLLSGFTKNWPSLNEYIRHMRRGDLELRKLSIALAELPLESQIDFLRQSFSMEQNESLKSLQSFIAEQIGEYDHEFILNELDDLDHELRQHLNSAAVAGYIRHSPSEALHWLNSADSSATEQLSNESLRNLQFQAVYAISHNTDDYSTALQQIMKIHDSKVKRFGIKKIAEQAVERNTAQAIDLALHQGPDGQMNKPFLNHVMSKWGQENPVEAADFLQENNTLPVDDVMKDIGLSLLSNNHVYKFDELYASTVNPRQKATLAYTAAINGLNSNDLDVAKKWMANIPEGSQKSRKTFDIIRAFDNKKINMEQQLKFIREINLKVSQARLNVYYAYTLKEWKSTAPLQVSAYLNSLPAERAKKITKYLNR